MKLGPLQTNQENHFVYFGVMAFFKLVSGITGHLQTILFLAQGIVLSSVVLIFQIFFNEA